MKKASAVMIIVAGVLWGTMGIFVRYFSDMGFSSIQTAALRISSCAILLIVFSLLTCGWKVFKISPRDIGWFLCSGVISVSGMSWLYFLSINSSSMCTAAILLYTAPFIVSVFAAILFKERFTLKKLVALITAFIGCILVTGTDGDATLPGVLFGIGSGFTYASYSLFGKILLKKYTPMTVTVYSFTIAAVVLLSACDVSEVTKLCSLNGNLLTTLLAAVLMGFVTAAVPFVLYTYGLKGTDAGKASVMAYVEPLTASVCGFIIFYEYLGITAISGIALIIFAVLLINNSKYISKD